MVLAMLQWSNIYRNICVWNQHVIHLKLLNALCQLYLNQKKNWHSQSMKDHGYSGIDYLSVSFFGGSSCLVRVELVDRDVWGQTSFSGTQQLVRELEFDPSTFKHQLLCRASFHHIPHSCVAHTFWGIFRKEEILALTFEWHSQQRALK